MTEVRLIEAIASATGKSTRKIRETLVSQGLASLLSEAQRLRFSERFGNGTITLQDEPIEARFIAAAYDQMEADK